MITETPERQHQVSCDICGNILDPGAADAPMGGYPTREAAQKAADAHDWFTARKQRTGPHRMEGVH